MIRRAAALFSAALIVAAAAQMPAQNPPNQSLGVNGSYGVGRMEGLAPDGQQKTTVVIVPINSCPIDMQARQRGLGAMMKTRKTPPQANPSSMPAPAQHIHLILSGFAKGKRVVSAIVTARGLSARSRMQNTSLVNGDTSDLRRTLPVSFAPDQDGSVSADIDLPAFTAVNSLRLDSITYADGSSWTPDKMNACTVQPDPNMLVAAQ